MRTFLLTAITAAVVAGTVAGQAPDYITSVYLKYYGRPPRPHMHLVWTLRLQSISPLQMEARVAGGDVYFREKAGRSNRGWVYALYRDVLLNRNPHPADVERWLHQLRLLPHRETAAEMFLAEYVPELARARAADPLPSPRPAADTLPPPTPLPPPPTPPLQFRD